MSQDRQEQADICAAWKRLGSGGDPPKADDRVKVLLPVTAAAFPNTDEEVTALEAGGYTHDDGEWIKDRAEGFIARVVEVRFLSGPQGAQWELLEEDGLSESFYLDESDLLDGRLPFVPA